MATTISLISAHIHKVTPRYSLSTLSNLLGSLPLKQRRLVEAWAELHVSELETAWTLLASGHPAGRIEPLK